MLENRRATLFSYEVIENTKELNPRTIMRARGVAKQTGLLESNAACSSDAYMPARLSLVDKTTLNRRIM